MTSHRFDARGPTSGSLSRVATVLLALLGAATPLPAQSGTATASPEIRNGFSTERLARIDSALQRAVDSADVAGAVALVLRDGKVVYEGAAGWADREAGRRMSPDAIFRIASQTKALTSVAALMLAEQGRLALGDPVSRYIPAYRQLSVAVQTDTGRALVPARRPLTIRDLLTHTAGLSYGTESLVAPLYARQGLGPEAGYGWYTADKDEPICTTMERLATLPLVAQPGERYVYGYATDVLGCVVERVSGKPLDTFFRERITEPLGMRDTHFFLPRQKRDRLTAVYTPAPDGSLARAPEGARGQGHYVEGPRRSYSGGAGLLSTARDYGRFLQMLLNGGTLDGVRLLAPSSVELMTSNQVGTLFSTDGLGFGLGFRLVQGAGAGGRVESEGAYGWGGAYGSSYMVDPEERLVYVFLSQKLPVGSDLQGRFPMLVYQALVEPDERE